MKDTKDRIMNVSYILFLKKGVGETSMHDIRKKGNFAMGTIYHYFKSKEDLVNQVMDKFILSILFESLDTSKRFEGTAKMKIYYSISEIESFNSRISKEIKPYDDFMIIPNYRNVHLLLFETLRIYDYVAKRYEKFSLELKDYIRGVIEEGISNNEIINRDPDTLANLVFATIHGLFQMSIIMSTMDIQDLLKESLSILFKEIELTN